MLFFSLQVFTFSSRVHGANFQHQLMLTPEEGISTELSLIHRSLPLHGGSNQIFSDTISDAQHASSYTSLEAYGIVSSLSVQKNVDDLAFLYGIMKPDYHCEAASPFNRSCNSDPRLGTLVPGIPFSLTKWGTAVDVPLNHHPLNKEEKRMKKLLCSEEHAQTMEVDLLGDFGCPDQTAEKKKRCQISSQKKRQQENMETSSQDIVVEVLTQVPSALPPPTTNQYDISHIPSWGIKTTNSAIGSGTIAKDMCYHSCTPYDRAQASILTMKSLNDHVNVAGAEVESAEKCRFKDECEKLKEENTVLRNTQEMAVLKGIEAYKISPQYHAE
ncbi:hypothetical protein Scep_005345 [Stephania cephalantha]|uniref:Uncharacterized protein n=1 Tax=Stephania cephalantha TaxID=152367 RepID=A0AAP0Q000_9MAGN